MTKFIYRLILPIINIKSFLTSVINFFRYPGFIYEFYKYKSLSNEKVCFTNAYPCLDDKMSTSQTGGGQYFYQDIWALFLIAKSQVEKHVDVGSRIDGFVGQCSAICSVDLIEYRPIELGLSNLNVIEGSILSLPYEDRSVSSLSCLHVIEHIGLGRYGDPVDIQGSKKSAKELSRVLSKGGVLYLGVPIGRERVEFNAHRIFNPSSIVAMFSELELIEFKAIDDKGSFVEDASLNDFDDADYSCGLFMFKRKK